MWSIHSLPLLSRPFWTGVIAPDWALSMGQIEKTVRKQMTYVDFWLFNSNAWNHLNVGKKELMLI